MQTKDEASPPTPPAPTPVPVAKKKPPAKKRTTEVKLKKLPTLSAKPASPSENLIKFHVKEGIAIAYGDVMLGAIEDEMTEGFVEAQIPQLWNDSEIPYFIAADLPNPQRVQAALTYLQQKTSLRFTLLQDQDDAIVFEKWTENCYSLLGKQGGHQPIRIADNCGTREILHELMHALGFPHEQSRSDRDQYVDILWDNIDPKYRDQFLSVPDSFMEMVKGTPFDYHSLMLYPTDMFALQKGNPTMRAKNGTPIQPVTAGLSEIDIDRLQRLYPR